MKRAYLRAQLALIWKNRRYYLLRFAQYWNIKVTIVTNIVGRGMEYGYIRNLSSESFHICTGEKGEMRMLRWIEHITSLSLVHPVLQDFWAFIFDPEARTASAFASPSGQLYSIRRAKLKKLM